MRPTARLLLAAALLSAALAGCGIDNPYDRRPARGAQTTTLADTLPPAPADGEMRSEPAAQDEPDRFPGAGTTPEATLRRAATLAGNWTSETAPDVYRRLVALSVGDARAAFEQIAAGARTDVQQTGAGAQASATVEAVVVRGEGDERNGIAVTRDRVVSPRLPHLPPEYRVTLATLERRGGVWTIATWSPQP